jgi:endonuclease/exonuclease/phosphatase family metal-dependent hydrolase
MATRERPREDIPEAERGLLEFGSFAPIDPARERSTLVIASYNIRYAVGSFLISGSIVRRLGLSMPGRRKRRVERHLSSAAEAFAGGRIIPAIDVLALQEVDRHTVRAGSHHIARELAEKLRMAFAYAPAARPDGEEPKARQWYLDFEEHISSDDNGQTGIAILSRLPISDVSRIELPWKTCPWRPRLALGAIIQAGARSINLYNAHIDPHAEIAEQLDQHAAILDRADASGAATILAGDFNTLSPRSCTAMKEFLESRGFSTPFATETPTWRAGLIRLHTDWIFVRGVEVKRFGVARPLGVSDHWPVWIEIDSRRTRSESA